MAGRDKKDGLRDETPVAGPSGNREDGERKEDEDDLDMTEWVKHRGDSGETIRDDTRRAHVTAASRASHMAPCARTTR